MDFKTYSFIFSKLDDFKKNFEILKISNIPIVQKMILYGEIILQLEKIIHIRIDYTGLSKDRSFIIIEVYPTTSNTILDSITSKIAILVNPTKRALKINKSIYNATIHEYVNTTYLIVNSSEIFAVLTAVSAAISKLLSLI